MLPVDSLVSSAEVCISCEGIITCVISLFRTQDILNLENCFISGFLCIHLHFHNIPVSLQIFSFILAPTEVRMSPSRSLGRPYVQVHGKRLQKQLKLIHCVDGSSVNTSSIDRRLIGLLEAGSHSTWMRTLVDIFSTSLALSCCFPCVKSGRTKVAPCAAKSLPIKNPRSAKTRSP